MPTVRYGGHVCELLEYESALDALLRSGAPVSYSCKAGACGSCMLRAIEGGVPAAAQAGLKDSWKARAYFLACLCHPEADLTAAPVDADAQVSARIASLDPLSADVMRVRLACDAPFEFRPGQYISLVRSDGLARSYSIASLPGEDIELHIRLLPNGRMSDWIRSTARPGDTVRILGPSGDCFYTPVRPEQPLLLIGTGTGLAPLYGILRDALQQGHTGPITLFHGAVRAEGLYLRDELAGLAGLTYVPTLLESDGPIDQLALQRFPNPAGMRAFLCGDPAIVTSLKKKLFLAGMNLSDIHADAFLPAA
jgi:CDP-4-dehydro-6-deoxyglucose reductase